MGQVNDNTLRIVAFNDNPNVGGMPVTDGGAMAAEEQGQSSLINLGIGVLRAAVVAGLLLRPHLARGR